ncbi:LysR family transcriptional regulator, chromosome initiation inhibitor [Klenkia marina]|uniref:LysR family transcriptional regulator, chromosome initiation inhibitor n=1 Tax=Klenkia marina TaxID=1960309 RepID=A0A1G4XVQ0_9ACTN|nr:LysR family transcriptional regulator ArgP [Klenkia marina]SCX44688.1 LysR family transcriptional regulator, chromosome initiation inhibitor [Klenkia marina]
MDLPQLQALAAAVEAGTLDGAARLLHVTPSAVSQRLRALETSTGQVLLVRSRPVVPTPAGAAVLRLARQVELLVADTRTALTGDEGTAGPPVLPLAVNADSLATWFLPAVAPLAADVQLDLRVADQTMTSALLRDGSVMAAVTADPVAVPGCTATRLGAMTYRPVAARAVADRWFTDGVTPAALRRAPVVVFDRTDDLQAHYLRRRAGDGPPPPTHHVPSSADYLAAVRWGMGWGMVPDLQTGPDDGLVELDAGGAVEVELWWQQWRLRSPSLDRVADAVRAAAAAALG